ncbi:MAG: AEC family transporter [Spirochaetales bacterium]|nr:AEC family transporter [Spirochaetales bacterium]
MIKILYSLFIVFSGLTTGYLLQFSSLFPYGSINNGKVRKILQRLVIIFLNPVAFIGSIWILDLRKHQLLFMPLSGLLALTSGGIFALITANYMKMSRKESGAFVACGSFTNIGNIGALVCYSFLGEKGFALVPFYKLFEDLFYYLIGFPFLRTFGIRKDNNHNYRKLGVKFDPMLSAVIISILTGFILNLSGIKRPDFFKPLNAVIIPLSSFTMLLTIGMALKFGKMRELAFKASAVLPVKYLAVPFITFLFAKYTGLGEIDSGLPLKVVLILSSMPVAILAMIPCTLYDLDLDLANTCWFFSMLLMVLTVPVLKIFITLI